jgi:NADPH-dependent curcumin reductase CurA
MIILYICRISKSENPDFPVGTYVKTMDGWRSHTIHSDSSKLNKLEGMEDLPKSLALGVLGMPGYDTCIYNTGIQTSIYSTAK